MKSDERQKKTIWLNSRSAYLKVIPEFKTAVICLKIDLDSNPANDGWAV